METPNSAVRRITRSQAAASNNKSMPISKLCQDLDQALLSKSRKEAKGGKRQDQQQERNEHPALVDITNSSPIVGLATGSLVTPSSSFAKKRVSRGEAMMTPGSGEALLRGQVKTLLQKVEEEAALSRVSLERRRPIFPYLHGGGLVSSPMGLLLAPTPVNTPQALSLSEDETAKNDQEELISQTCVMEEIFERQDAQRRSLLNRSLLLDLDCEDHDDKKSLTDDDNSSVWSVQVNASAGNESFQEEEDDDDDAYVHEVWTGVKNMSITAVKFEGKHTRFVYNSDDGLAAET
ncbi:hypothetical protein SAY87_028955 [Trapa incisa]|uniref:Uncharacterized protein n=1 Tax=Trapa incisa TaxID=236973 RepID=A0AAN7KVQ4_9MYRT|nr:hypothetical protein SAY87_028955 [Trapa incisa]